MARNGVGSWRRRSLDQFGGSHSSPCGSEEVHVLAVDDNLVDQKVIERLFKIFSCKVTAVHSGIRALEFLGLDGETTAGNLNGLQVDLIVTDYCMPGMTGYELLKKIKGSSALRDIPVVIMSSENVLARIDMCLEEGAEDFIGKPVKLSDVKRLKDFVTRDVVDRVRRDGGGTTQRRKQQESFNVSSSASSVSSASSLPSAPTTPSRSPSPLVSSSKPVIEESHRHLNCRKEGDQQKSSAKGILACSQR